MPSLFISTAAGLISIVSAGLLPIIRLDSYVPCSCLRLANCFSSCFIGRLFSGQYKFLSSESPRSLSGPKSVLSTSWCLKESKDDYLCK